MQTKKRSLHRKKTTAKNAARRWKNKGYNARIGRGKTQVGTQKSSTVKGWAVYTSGKKK